MNQWITKSKDYLENSPESKISFFLVIILLLVFSPAFFGHEFLTYDDNWYIYENKNITNFSWDALVQIFTTPHGGQYSPIGESFMAILYSFFGKNAALFKVSGVLVHTINTILIFNFFNYLSQNRILSIFIALVFAIHPVQVELVVWVSGIYKIATLFMLFGMVMYIKYLNSKKIKYFVVVVSCFILALLTKEQAVLFPISLIFINLIRKEYLFQRRVIFENVVLGIISITYALFTLRGVTANVSFIQKDYTFYEKFYLFIKAVVNYSSSFLFPFGLSFSYPTAIAVDLNGWGFVLGIFIILLVIGVFFSIRNKKILFGNIWSIGFLSIALSFPFFSIREVYMADRYVYLAIIGMAFSLYYLLKWLVLKFERYKILIYSLTGAYILFLAILCFKRVSVFKNSYTLWSNAIQVNPDNYLAHNSLGFYYRTQGNNEKALDHYKKSISIYDNYYLSHNNIAKVYSDQEDYKSALFHVSRSIDIQPNYFTGYENRVKLYLRLNKPDSLVLDLNKLLSNSPNNIQFLKERARAYFKLKKYKKAIADASKLLSLVPDDPMPNYLIGHSSFLLKDDKKANLFMNRAIALDPKKAKYYFVRSLCRFRMNKHKEALKDALLAKKMGHKVNDIYISVLAGKVKNMQ